jgi:hypothetical protein
MAYLGHYQYHDHHRRRLPSFLRIEADQLSPLIRSMTALKTQGAGGTIHAVTERDVSGHVASTRGSTVRHQAIRQASWAGERISRLDAACDVLV